MMDLKKYSAARDHVKSCLPLGTDTLIVCGTGVELFKGFQKIANDIPYDSIPTPFELFDSFHKKLMSFYEFGGHRCCVMHGRLHYYEGYTMEQVVYYHRILALAGVKRVIISNAAGAINPTFHTGQIVALKDQINFMGDGPLRGQNPPSWGVQFPDVQKVYCSEMREVFHRACKEIDLPVHEAVYIGVAGSQLETPSELRMYAQWGADLIGMSTVPEALALHQMGVKILGVSVVANQAPVGDVIPEITLEEVQTNVQASSDRLSRLLVHFLKQL